jgi:hypothetical protein
MNESIAAMLAQEADEAEARADAEERGDETPSTGQRARRQSTEASQVYSVRIPTSRLEELRKLANRLGEPPSALLRRWALERLDEELQGSASKEKPYRELMETIRSFVDQAVEGRMAKSSKPNAAHPVTRTGTLKKHYAPPSSAVRLGATRRLKSNLTIEEPFDKNSGIPAAQGGEK